MPGDTWWDYEYRWWHGRVALRQWAGEYPFYAHTTGVIRVVSIPRFWWLQIRVRLERRRRRQLPQARLVSGSRSIPTTESRG